jgi:hypothetical protein
MAGPPAFVGIARRITLEVSLDEMYHHPMSSLRWYHTQIWLYGHWLPGDPRGFRSHDHRIHSSGDYKHRPPTGEHAGLNRHARNRLKNQPITLSDSQRECIGQLLVRWFELKQRPLAAASVGGAHAHLLAALPGDAVDATIGKVKRYASTESRRRDATLPSKLFALKGEPKSVRDFEHFAVAYDYVVEKHAREGAWTWGRGERLLGELWRLDPGQGGGPP